MMAKRFTLQLRGTESGAVLPADHMAFYTRKGARTWVKDNATGVSLTRWEIVDWGPWWVRLSR